MLVLLLIILMDSTTCWLLDWKVLDWNVRGLNDKNKRLLVYNKIEERNCAVVCLQETKCEDLITHLSGPSALKDLTDLLSLPQWVHLEASLYYGTVLFSMVIYYRCTNLLSE